jgi:ABC-type histidine transport system ATPase subunit
MISATPLVVRDLRKSYASLEVLKGVSLTASKGDVVAIIGGSGSGKSTFLRCINFLETPSAGEISLFGEPVRPTRLSCGACAPASAWCSRTSTCGRT